jgi:aryl-alcohol dehydrogenase-like predicted oxidoreductase
VSIPGFATADGTRRFRDRAVDAKHAVPSHFRTAPGDLTLSSLGLGTYIGRPDAPTDLAVEESVRISVGSGRINVIDTAINYRYQRAERSVGRSLQRLLEGGTVAREDVFVATKVGYFAPDAESPIPADEWIEHELVRPGILDPADIVGDSHAMSPSYLRDQAERSRTNLGLDCVDLLYLHNAPDAQLAVVGAVQFRERLLTAFRVLEELRADGRLRAYGLATWDCLRAEAGSRGFSSLGDAVQLAAEAGGRDHGLRFIQFPFNLAMTEAATRRNQFVDGEERTLFDAAARLGLGCFTSVPLVQGQLARRGPTVDGLTSAQTALQFARSAPHGLTALVGQKSAMHLAENLALAELPPLSPTRVRELMA